MLKNTLHLRYKATIWNIVRGGGEIHLTKFLEIYIFLKLSKGLTQYLGLTGLSVLAQKEDTVYQFKSELI